MRCSAGLTLTVSLTLIGCISQKYYDRPSTPLARPIRILNNTSSMLDIRYAGKLVRARLSPKDSFDLYRGTWGYSHSYAVAVVGFDSSGRFVGTATRNFQYRPDEAGFGEIVTKSLERQGITGGRKE